MRTARLVLWSIGLAVALDGNKTYYACCSDNSPHDCRVECEDTEEVPKWYKLQVSCWGGLKNLHAGRVDRDWCCFGLDALGGGCFSDEYPRQSCCMTPGRLTLATDLRMGLWTETTCTGNFDRLSCPWRGREPQGLLLYCGPRLAQFVYDLSLMVLAYHYSLIAKEWSGDPAVCFDFYVDEVLGLHNALVPRFNKTILLSPFLERFEILDIGHALDALVQYSRSHNPAASVIGLPTITNQIWELPIFRIRHSFWKLSYSRYPTGYASWPTANAKNWNCFGGDTTSGTRVYDTTLLLELLGKASQLQALGFGADLLVHLDLALKARDMPALTCLTPSSEVLQETSYLLHARLGATLSKLYAVEAAQFHPNRQVVTSCETKQGLSDAMSMNGRGLVVSYCYRKSLREGMRRLQESWSQVASSGARAYPVFGTFISIFRLGPFGDIMPWDYDADIVLESERVDLLRFRNILERVPFNITVGAAESPCWVNGEVHWKLEYTAWNATIEIDVFIHKRTVGATPSLSGQVWISGFAVNVSTVSITLAANSYERSGIAPKSLSPFVHPASTIIACLEPGHNACFPDSSESNGFMRAEFSDDFVHLDSWPFSHERFLTE